MAINTLEYAKIFQAQLDTQLIEAATSGWMEANAGQVKYNGGNEVKIPKISMDGLGDYDRDDGFAQGSVTLSYQTKTLTQDRGRTFHLDAMDVDETNFVAAAGAVMGEFQKTKVIPEIDAYRYSKIAGLAAGASKSTTYTPAASSVLTKLLEDIAKVQDIVGGAAQMVISMSTPVLTMLNTSTEISKKLDVTDFRQGEIGMRVRSLDGNPIISVPSARMKTAYTFYDGKTPSDGAESNPTPDQRIGGFVPTSSAKDINWIICVRTAPIAVSKTDLTRIFDPLTNQSANAWKIDYRKYHDLWIPDNKLDGIWVNTK